MASPGYRQYLCSAGGQDDEDPVVARQWYREMIEEADPERQLRLNARNSRAAKERAGTMLTVIRDAAPVDPDAADLWRLIQSDFHRNQASVTTQLLQKKALRPELDVDRATDILWTVNHPDVWRLLTVDRGWSAEAYEAYETWTADTACRQLLPD